MKSEESNLRERRKVVENKADRLKNYLKNMLLTAGKDKVEGAKAKISITKGRESIQIVDVNKLLQYPVVWKEYQYIEANVSKNRIRLIDGCRRQS